MRSVLKLVSDFNSELGKHVVVCSFSLGQIVICSLERVQKLCALQCLQSHALNRFLGLNYQWLRGPDWRQNYFLFRGSFIVHSGQWLRLLEKQKGGVLLCFRSFRLQLAFISFVALPDHREFQIDRVLDLHRGVAWPPRGEAVHNS
jgi:hypothetical protein